MVVILYALCIVAFMPAHAWAWGPITHLTHGSEVLANVTILTAALQRLLHRHRIEYLYGCVGADITQAKKYTRALQVHCHSWPVGWALLEQAHSDAQRAFAYGYLTHLAGDVYSHNHYVPTQLVVSFEAVTLRHVYWEARFDSMQDEHHRDIIGELRARAFPECDQLVEEVVSRTLFPFSIDKRIFDGFIAVHDLGQWHAIMQQLATRSRYLLPPDITRRYNHACNTAVVDIFQNGKRADCQNADPTGLEALNLAKEVRATLKTLRRAGRLSPKLRRTLAQLNERPEISFEPLLPA